MAKKEGEKLPGVAVATIINKKLAEARRLLKNIPEVLPALEAGVRDGKGDQEVLEELGVRGSRRAAEAIQTLRWRAENDIPKRTPEQNQEILRRERIRWGEENPELQRENQRRAAEAGRIARTGRPRKYTPEIQEAIRQELESGATYEEAAAKLQEMGIEADAAQVKYAAGQWGIKNRTREIEAQRKNGVEEKTLKLAAQGLGRREILERMNESEQTLALRALIRLGVRDNVDWNRTRLRGTPLRDVAIECYRRYGNTERAFAEFNAELEGQGLEPVTMGSFTRALPKGLRKR